MFDLGWTEMLVIAVVAVVVIGPKDLPRALRTAGQWMGRIRGMARDFQHHIDDMVRESELDELRQKANNISNYDPSGLLKDDDPTGGKPGEQATPTAADEKAADEAMVEADPPHDSTNVATANVAPAHSLGENHGKPAAETAETTSTDTETDKDDTREGATAAPGARV